MLVASIVGATESEIAKVPSVGDEISNDVLAEAELLHKFRNALDVPVTVCEALQGPTGLIVAELSNPELYAGEDTRAIRRDPLTALYLIVIGTPAGYLLTALINRLEDSPGERGQSDRQLPACRDSNKASRWKLCLPAKPSILFGQTTLVSYWGGLRNFRPGAAIGSLKIPGLILVGGPNAEVPPGTIKVYRNDPCQGAQFAGNVHGGRGRVIKRKRILRAVTCEKTSQFTDYNEQKSKNQKQLALRNVSLIRIIMPQPPTLRTTHTKFPVCVIDWIRFAKRPASIGSSSPQPLSHAALQIPNLRHEIPTKPVRRSSKLAAPNPQLASSIGFVSQKTHLHRAPIGSHRLSLFRTPRSKSPTCVFAALPRHCPGSRQPEISPQAACATGVYSKPSIRLRYNCPSLCPYEILNAGRKMSKEDSIEVTGTVVEKFPSGLFSVQLDQERKVLAHLAGKLRRNRIRVLAGDRVTLELSPYDLTKGRITYRHK